MIKGEEIRGGMLIGDRRVASMTRGMVNGTMATTVRFETRNRRGKKRLSQPVTYLHGAPVPGTKTLTTWAMPAGPVHLEPGREQRRDGGTRQMGGWWGDGDATDRGSRADRHQRRIESIVYA